MILTGTHKGYAFFVDQAENPRLFNIVKEELGGTRNPTGGYGDPLTILKQRGFTHDDLCLFGTGTLIRRQIDHLAKHVMETIIELRRLKEKYPEMANSYYPTRRGSLLNAYREGDLTFDECLKELETATMS